MARRLSKAPQKEWAMLAYIAGDNNLSDYGLSDIREMEEEGTSGKVYAGIEIDTEGDYDGSVRYEISEPDWTESSHRMVIERLPERDTGSPAVLRDFLKWGLERYRARNSLLVIWGHGAGFRVPKRDVAFDDFGGSLTIPEIDGVLKDVGIGTNKKAAILGFDACMMCMLEVAHHLSDRVEYLVGSEQTEPGDGWPYKDVLKALKARLTSPEHVAKAIVKAYEEYYRRKATSVTQSAIRLRDIPAAVSAWNQVGTLLARHLDKHQGKSQIKSVRQVAQSYEYNDFIDLIHFMTLLADKDINPAITSAALSAAKLANKCVVQNTHKGAVVANSNGLSMWFPLSGDLFYEMAGKYAALKCNRPGSGWLKFLDAYHS